MRSFLLLFPFMDAYRHSIPNKSSTMVHIFLCIFYRCSGSPILGSTSVIGKWPVYSLVMPLTFLSLFIEAVDPKGYVCKKHKRIN
jgi:hypothetical protein